MNRFAMLPAEAAAHIESRRKDFEQEIARAVGVQVDVSVSIFPYDNDNDSLRLMARAAISRLGWKISRSRKPYARSLYIQSKTSAGHIGRTCIYTNPPAILPAPAHKPEVKQTSPTSFLVLPAEPCTVEDANPF